MSLLTKNEQTTAVLANGVDKISANITVAVRAANRLALDLLALSNDDLCEWLNSKSVDKRMSEFTAHASLGECLNNAIEVIEKFTSTTLVRVDTRPFQEKLASQKRELFITESGFSIVNTTITELTIVDEDTSSISTEETTIEKTEVE